MTNKPASSRDLIARLVAETLRLGGNALDVEYKDGHESVCAMRDNVGFGIATIPSSSAKARQLRKRLYAMTKKKESIKILGKSYTLKAELYDSFGEDAFRVAICGK